MGDKKGEGGDLSLEQKKHQFLLNNKHISEWKYKFDFFRGFENRNI